MKKKRQSTDSAVIRRDVCPLDEEEICCSKHSKPRNNCTWIFHPNTEACPLTAPSCFISTCQLYLDTTNTRNGLIPLTVTFSLQSFTDCLNTYVPDSSVDQWTAVNTLDAQTFKEMLPEFVFWVFAHSWCYKLNSFVDLKISVTWEEVCVCGRHLLCSPLLGSLALVVDPAEVGDDDRNRQGDDQHAAQRADGAEDLPHDGLWYHVAISDGEAREHQRLDFTLTLRTFMKSNINIQHVTHLLHQFNFISLQHIFLWLHRHIKSHLNGFFLFYKTCLILETY